MICTVIGSVLTLALLVPAHVLDFTFWNQSGIATQVPTDWVARNVTFVETGSHLHADAFHAAGGRYTIVAGDPVYYFVDSTYHSHGAYPESAFAHDAFGRRLQRPQGDGVEYYLLANSPAALEAYRRATQTDVGSSYDIVFVDGVSDSFQTSLYRMSGAPIELSSNDEYVAGVKKMIAAAVRPTIINGFNNGDPVAFAQTYGSARNVMGVYGEACLHQDSGPKIDAKWRADADALLSITAQGRFAICGGHGTDADNRAERLYWLASWWLTYDPTRSVAMEAFDSPGGVDVFPEIQLVPTDPIQSATTDIDRLRTSSGAYVREFRRCYNRGMPVGPCAALVNPSATTVDVPALTLSYSRSLWPDQNNLFDGGKLGFARSVPSVLQPGQAAIVLR